MAVSDRGRGGGEGRLGAAVRAGWSGLGGAEGSEICQETSQSATFRRTEWTVDTDLCLKSHLKSTEG